MRKRKKVRSTGAPTPLIKPRSAVERLQSDRPRLESQSDRDGLRLDLNENTSGPAPAVLRWLRRSVEGGWLSRYPEYDAARAAMARCFKVAPEELILTNGVDDAIDLICATFVEPGDRLVIPAPTFPMYAFFHERAGGRVITVDCDACFRLPVARILQAVRRGARWLALANPNNPTGTLIPRPALRTVLKSAPQTLVLVDEAYFDFSGSTVLPWINRFPNLIVARTFSKAYGLAGLRLGLLFSNRQVTSMMRRAHAVFPANSLALACALEAIRHPEHVRRYARMVNANRAWLRRRLAALGAPTVPSAANFVFARMGAQAPEVARGLRRSGILVRDWPESPPLQPYLRITVGTSAEMRRLVKALERMRSLIGAAR